jgi:DNA helicase-2/ATP-dependent DNA helicase PcrA
MNSNYAELNDEQQHAVFHYQGPALVLAGAGSGKTRVITYRIVRLIRDYQIDPFLILAVTFTNKAAQEMKTRIQQLIPGEPSQKLFIGTFHSLGLKILKLHAEKLGYRVGFSIYDEADQKNLMKECFWDLKWDEKQIPLNTIRSYISAAKNDFKLPDAYEKIASGFLMEKASQAYKLYQKKLQQNNSMDFDDLILNVLILFKKFPEVLMQYQNRFQYLFVDEYQDINRSQYQLVQNLVHRHNNLYVVGDPDQSIYGWRGADIQNILQFEADFPGSCIFKLQKNYRSTRSIIQVAQSVIQNNIQRKSKDLFSMREIGEQVVYFQASDDKEEAKYIIQTIQNRINESRNFRHFAILYRTNAQSRVLEDALRRENIPYQIIGGLKFYDRKEIKDMLAYLRVVVNPSDSVSLKRIINVPIRGIGSSTVERLENQAQAQGESLFQVLCSAVETTTFPKKTLQAMDNFVSFLSMCQKIKDHEQPTDLFKIVLEKSGYLAALQAEDEIEAKMRIENLSELANSITDYEKNCKGKNESPTLEDYLNQVSIISEVDKLEDKRNSVVLMTLHNAKGLEFPIVFIAGFEEGLIPHSNSIKEDESVEEERRLCYVGITRAMDALYLTGCVCRSFYGSPVWKSASRFLTEIPSNFLKKEGISTSFLSTENGTYEIENHSQKSKIFDEDIPEVLFHIGEFVKHKTFGSGVIISLSGSQENLQVTVSFTGYGKKKLLARNANLQKIDSLIS